MRGMPEARFAFGRGLGVSHLRLVGCWDSSPAKHARRHTPVIVHPIVQSVEPGEDWRWFYFDETDSDLSPPLGRRCRTRGGPPADWGAAAVGGEEVDSDIPRGIDAARKKALMARPWIASTIPRMSASNAA